MTAAKPKIAAAKMPESVSSAQAGLTVKPCRALTWRERHCSATAAAVASAARIQLPRAPSVPSAPPPSSAKVGSSGATVWPVVIHQAAPRQTRRPPRVTMKAGIVR